MKNFVLLFSLLLLSVHLTSCNQGDRLEDGPFYFAENGITIKAKDSVLVGTQAMFNGITYTLVNDSSIQEIKGQGWSDNSFIKFLTIKRGHVSYWCPLSSLSIYLMAGTAPALTSCLCPKARKH